MELEKKKFLEENLKLVRILMGNKIMNAMNFDELNQAHKVSMVSDELILKELQELSEITQGSFLYRMAWANIEGLYPLKYYDDIIVLKKRFNYLMGTVNGDTELEIVEGSHSFKSQNIPVIIAKIEDITKSISSGKVMAFFRIVNSEEVAVTFDVKKSYT